MEFKNKIKLFSYKNKKVCESNQFCNFKYNKCSIQLFFDNYSLFSRNLYNYTNGYKNLNGLYFALQGLDIVGFIIISSTKKELFIEYVETFVKGNNICLQMINKLEKLKIKKLEKLGQYLQRCIRLLEKN